VRAEPQATIWVVAGPNGGGKSSIIGEMIREAGADYFNPDELTEKLIDRNPSLGREAANAVAWQEGRKRLQEAIEKRQSFALETTLGGRTICRLLHAAADSGIMIKIWFIALDSADRHVARVRARVASGGHDIPEERIRARYDASRANLSLLLPKTTSVKVYDNSYDAVVERGEAPRPKLLLDFASGRIKNRRDFRRTPDWAKPIVAAALKAETAKRRRHSGRHR
jgi:predicted ABC-type ATPase